jgi:hypothetical protein
MIQKPPCIGYGICVSRWLHRQFPDHLIGRRRPMEGSPMSPDFTALDFYLWGHLKAKIYQVKIQNLDYLKEDLRA